MRQYTMFNSFIDTYNDINLLYAAVATFITAVLFELWLRTNKTRKNRHAAPLSDRMEKAIHYFNENERRIKITNNAYQKLTGVSDATATRDLDKLEELGLLIQKGRNRGTYYLPTQKTKKHIASHKTRSKRTAH